MHNLSGRFAVAAVGITLVLLALSSAASAQTFTVTNLTDSGASGDGSLRGEVVAANAAPGADTIDFAGGLAGTITLSGDGLQIHEALDIEGPGPGQLTVAQSSQKRVVHIEMSGAAGPVMVAGLHIANGTSSEGGGDIYNDDSHPASGLTVVNSAITGGTAGEYGGGIDGDGAPLTVRSTSFEGDKGNGAGAVWAGDDGGVAVTIESSTFSGNSATEFGGALFIEGQEGGNAIVANSSFSANSSGEEAGAIAISTDDETNVAVVNSTITGNTSASDGGGGIQEESEGEDITIADSTIAANHASGAMGDGGGIDGSVTHPVKLEDTIVAGNTAAVGGADLSGAFMSAFDLVGDSNGATLTETSPGSDLLRVDPQLGALQANGGPTPTMALPPSSPAVNKGGGRLATDQRGLTRPVAYPGIPSSSAVGANGADIGAYELQAPPPAPLAPATKRIKLGKLKRNEKTGTATLAVTVPGPGVLRLAGSKTLKAASVGAKGAATLKLVIRAKGKARKRLAKKGKVKVKARIAFAPAEGVMALSATRSIVLKKRLRK